jgi:bifunctional non-homologous end joining protein LigD
MPFPERIQPMEPTDGKKLVDKPDWYYEPKMDGFRAIVYVQNGQVRMHSRQYKPFSKSAIYEELSPQLAKLPHSVILDGEIIAEDENGYPDFWTLATASNDALRKVPISLFCFDIMQFDEFNLTSLPLKERRPILRELLSAASLRNVCCIPHVEGRGQAFYLATVKQGTEGIVVKDPNSLYRGGKTKLWQKFKDPEYVKRELEWRKKFNSKS